MPQVFTRPDGSYSPHPSTREDAKKLRKSRYDDGIKCLKCNYTSIKYTANDRCIHCARLEALHFYNAVVHGVPFPEGMQADDAERIFDICPSTQFITAPNNPQQAVHQQETTWVRVEPCNRAGHLGVRTLNGLCFFCEEGRQKGSPRQRAIAAGDAWYAPDEPCPRCGQHAPKRVANGECSGCHPAAPRPQSPRQRALIAGQAWYTPDEPCERCGQRAERRVNNGECSGCVPRKRNKGDEGLTPAQIIMRDQPDMLLTRDDARALGLPVYRTGSTCKRGHTGFRYTSTGACVDCVALLAGRKGVPS